MTTPLDPWRDRVRRSGERLAGWRHVSAWFPVTQEAIDRYAQSVVDPDPMHVDPTWARANTPYGGTIAQGLWTTAMLVRMLHDSGLAEELFRELEAPIGLNYGFDRLRLIEPVPVGCSIRGTIGVKSLEAKDDRTAILRLDARVDTDRASRPAVAGEWILAFRKAETTAGAAPAS